MTGFSQEEVYDTFEVEKCGKPMSLDAEFSNNGNSDGSSLAAILGGEDPQFEVMVNRLTIINAFRCLNQREKTIIYLKFYAGLSQSRIAELLGVSQMHVSRLQRHAVGELKTNLMK